MTAPRLAAVAAALMAGTASGAVDALAPFEPRPRPKDRPCGFCGKRREEHAADARESVNFDVKCLGLRAYFTPGDRS